MREDPDLLGLNSLLRVHPRRVKLLEAKLPVQLIDINLLSLDLGYSRFWLDSKASGGKASPEWPLTCYRFSNLSTYKRGESGKVESNSERCLTFESLIVSRSRTSTKTRYAMPTCSRRAKNLQ